jgi:saccharopepsin
MFLSTSTPVVQISIYTTMSMGYWTMLGRMYVSICVLYVTPANVWLQPSLDLTLTYGRGGVSGNVSQIDVSFAGFNVANQSFLYVTKTNQTAIVESRLAAGLLGLGFDTTSSINSLVQLKFPGETWGRSLLTNIFLSDLSTPNHIAFRLNRLYDNNDTDTGSFDIGTFAPGFEAVNNTAEIPIFTTSPDRNRYWTVLVDGVAVNGKNQTLKTTITNGAIPPNGKLAAVLDTGYSYSQVTPEIAAAIYEPIGGIFNTTYSLYVVPCEAQANVTFYIG